MDTFVALDIEVRVRMSVSRQKLAQTQGVRGVTRSNKGRVTQPVGQHPHSAQDESPHEDVAELRVALHHAPQALVVHVENLAGLLHATADEGPPPRKHADLTGKLAGLLNDDELLAGESWSKELQGTRKDHVDTASGLPRLDQNLPGAH